mgnify:CR=1 FL=1
MITISNRLRLFCYQEGFRAAAYPVESGNGRVEVVNYSAGTYKGLTAKVQVLNMDASVAWEKETTVDSNEDTTDKCIELEFPENLSKVHFIKMTLTEDGKVVSDNFYHRSLEENNYQDLCQLAKVALQSATTVDKNADGTWSAVSVIENKTSTPALMIRLNVVGGKDDQQIPTGILFRQLFLFASG